MQVAAEEEPSTEGQPELAAQAVVETLLAIILLVALLPQTPAVAAVRGALLALRLTVPAAQAALASSSCPTAWQSARRLFSNLQQRGERLLVRRR